MTAIRLQFHRLRSDAGERIVAVEAVDVRTKEPVTVGSIPDVARWLTDNGFRWCAGTNGIWQAATVR